MNNIKMISRNSDLAALTVSDLENASFTNLIEIEGNLDSECFGKKFSFNFKRLGVKKVLEVKIGNSVKIFEGIFSRFGGLNFFTLQDVSDYMREELLKNI